MESPSLGMFTKLRKKLVKGRGYEDFDRFEQENIGPHPRKYERSRSSSLEKQRKNRIINGEPVTWHNYTYDICLQSETIPSKPRSAPSTPVKKRDENIARLNYPREYTEGYKYETKHRNNKHSNRQDSCVKYYATHSGNKSTKIGISRDKVADQNTCPIHNPSTHCKPKDRTSKSLPQDTNICPVHPNRSWSYTDHANGSKTTGRIKNKDKSFGNNYNTQPKRRQKPLSLNNSQGQRPPTLPKKQNRISFDEVDSPSTNSSNNFSLGKEIEQKIANIATVSVPNKEDTIAQYQITVTVNKVETPCSSVQSSALPTPVGAPSSLEFPQPKEEPKTETVNEPIQISPEKKPDIIENHTVNTNNETDKKGDTIRCDSCGQNTDSKGTESKSNSLVKSPALEQRKHESPLPVQKVKPEVKKPEVKVPFRPISKEKKEQLELAKSFYQSKSGETTPETQDNVMSKSFEGFLNEKREHVSCYTATENGTSKKPMMNIGPSTRRVEIQRNKEVFNRNRSISCGDGQAKEPMRPLSTGATSIDNKPKPRRLHSYSGYEDIKEDPSPKKSIPDTDDAYEDVELPPPPPPLTPTNKGNEVTVDVEVHREFLTYAELENPSNATKTKTISPKPKKEESVPYADIAINRLSSDINQNVERMISRESGYETSENHTGSLERLQLTEERKGPIYRLTTENPEIFKFDKNGVPVKELYAAVPKSMSRSQTEESSEAPPMSPDSATFEEEPISPTSSTDLDEVDNFVEEDTLEEDEDYLPPIPKRNYGNNDKQQGRKLGSVSSDDFEVIEGSPKENTALLNSMHSDASAESFENTLIRLSEPVHMSWDEVMHQAQKVGVPLNARKNEGTLKTRKVSESATNNYALSCSPDNKHNTFPLDRSKKHADKTSTAKKKSSTFKDRFSNIFHRKGDATINRQDGTIQKRTLPPPPEEGYDTDGSPCAVHPSSPLHTGDPKSKDYATRKYQTLNTGKQKVSQSDLQGNSKDYCTSPRKGSRSNTQPYAAGSPARSSKSGGSGGSRNSNSAPPGVVAPPSALQTQLSSSPGSTYNVNGDFIGSLSKLKDVGWYWGPLGWDDAEAKLSNKPDGSFLVRDSSDERYILSLSFRSQNTTHHTRIEHYKGMFSFYSQPKSHGAATIIEFIDKAMEHSRSGQFLYFLRPRAPGLPPAPVQLLFPVSRFKSMKSLQHACRFEILKHVRKDHIRKLPVPQKIQDYLLQSQYYIEYSDDGLVL